MQVNYNNGKVFYLVIREEANGSISKQCTPSKRHLTYMDARTEAFRLASKHLGLRFYVLKATDYVRYVDIEHVKLKEYKEDKDDYRF